MRKLGLVSCLAIASLITVYACTLNSTPDPSKDTSDVALPGNSEAPSASPDETAEPLGITAESLGITTDAITPNTCNVTLNFCDTPNSAVGTDCTQSSGCSGFQVSVCESIVKQVGCVEHCNAVMRNSSGTVIDTWRHQCGSTCCPKGAVCAGTSCCSTGVVCGSTCCPSGDFCGRNNACCDGVHINSNCPG